MKLQMVVIDLEVPARVKRWAIRLAVPAVILSGAGLAWSAALKNNWQEGDTLMASDLNANFSAAEQRIAMLESQLAALQSADRACPPGYGKEPATGFTICTRSVTLGSTALTDAVVKVGDGVAAFWIDQYEATIWDGTGTLRFSSADDSNSGTTFAKNGQSSVPWQALSASNATVTTAGAPARNVTWFQAQAACRAAGKRLPTGEEWLAGARGTFDPGANPDASGTASPTANTKCNTSSTGPRAPGKAGSKALQGSSCVSDWGAEDMIGNVSEITAEWLAGTAYPGTQDGQSATAGLSKFGATYQNDGVWGVTGAVLAESGSQATPAVATRGGLWGDGALAGVFSVGLNRGPTQWSGALGFRCVVR